MKYQDRIVDFIPPEFATVHGIPTPNPPTRDQLLPPPPGFWAKLFGGTAKYANATAKAQIRVHKLWNDHENREKARLESLAQDHAAFQVHLRKLELSHDHNCIVWQNTERQMRLSDQEAIERHYAVAISSLEGAFGETQINSLAYKPSIRRLVVEVELPHWEVLNCAKEHKYISIRDEFTTVMRSEREIVPMYKKIIEGTALAILHTAFAEDLYDHVDSAVVHVSMRTAGAGVEGDFHVTHASLGTTKKAYWTLDHQSPDLVRLHLAGSITSRPRMLKSVKRLVDDCDLAQEHPRSDPAMKRTVSIET